MNLSKPLMLTLISLVLLSCNRNLTVVYYNDNSKVDDGEIFGENLSSFFIPDPNIYYKKIKSAEFNNNLRTIKDSLSQIPTNAELDDSYYGYAFITSSNDTLFANYSLDYWKYNKRGHRFTNEQLKTKLKLLFNNPYLK